MLKGPFTIEGDLGITDVILSKVWILFIPITSIFSTRRSLKIRILTGLVNVLRCISDALEVFFLKFAILCGDHFISPEK